MKTLYLVRHAKSDWGNEQLSDMDRPLNARGYRDAHAMGAKLFRKKELPEGVVSSDAVRALSTAVILMRELELETKKLEVRSEVYEASAEQLLEIVRGLDEEKDVIMLVGHNPGATRLVNRICDASIDNIPTCGVLCIDLPVSVWKEAGLVDGTLRYFDFPKKKD